MINGVLSRLRRLPADRRGGATAVELALLLPAFSALVIGVVQYGTMTLAYQRMHDGLATAAVYVMRGGTNATTIHSLALGAWTSQPTDAAVTVAQTCTCSGVAGSCSALCSDGSYTKNYTTITATGTFSGPMASQAMSSSQVIRTQ